MIIGELPCQGTIPGMVCSSYSQAVFVSSVNAGGQACATGSICCLPHAESISLCALILTRTVMSMGQSKSAHLGCVGTCPGVFMKGRGLCS